MIVGLRGRVAAKSADAFTVDVGGVIYHIGTSTATLTELGDVGDPVEVHTFLLVREDQLALYGFLTENELAAFETLIGVTGVGPRLACAILSRLPVDRLLNAIHDGNADLLATVPGVGKKTAGRLILDLRGKLPESSGGATPAAPVDGDVVAALRALGYTAPEAIGAASTLTEADGTTLEERVVAALQRVGGLQ